MCVYWFGDTEIRIHFFAEVIDLLCDGHNRPQGSFIVIDFLVENCAEKTSLKSIRAVYPRAFGKNTIRIDPETNKRVIRHEFIRGEHVNASAIDASDTFPPNRPDDETNSFYRDWGWSKDAKVDGRWTVNMPDMKSPENSVPLTGACIRARNSLSYDRSLSHQEWSYLSEHNCALFQCDMAEPVPPQSKRWLRWKFTVPHTGLWLTEPKGYSEDPFTFSVESNRGKKYRKRINTVFYQIIGPYQIPCQVVQTLRAALRTSEPPRSKVIDNLMDKTYGTGFGALGSPTPIEYGWITLKPSRNAFLSNLCVMGSAYQANYGPQNRSPDDQSIRLWYQVKTGDYLFPRASKDFPFDSPPPIQPNDPFGRFIVNFHQTQIGEVVENM
jgi:hypothetical protein